MKSNEEPIIIEQTFNRPVEIVWNSITDIKLMRQWYFDNIPSFKPEVGFEWKVTEVIPLKLIKYNWRYEDYFGDSHVIFELFKQNTSTLLRLTHIVNEDFSDDIPEFSRESGLQGWTYFIKESLVKYIEAI
jgi:uncharacterized protein YndB with AHSA1/START domain